MSVQRKEEEAQQVRPAQNTTLHASEQSEDANIDNNHKLQQEDSNEALEDVQHSSILEPEEIAKSAPQPDELRLADDGDVDDDGDDDEDQQIAAAGEIERRLFVGSKLSDELKRLREQRAKRLNLSRKHNKQKRKRNKKKRRQISGKNLAKMTQTRQSSSSTQVYDGSATSSATDASVVQLNQEQTNQLAASNLRQLLPSHLNLSAAVQRLIMSKLTGNNRQHQQQSQTLAGPKKFANEQQAVASQVLLGQPLANLEFLQPAEDYRGDHQLRANKHHQSGRHQFLDGQLQRSPPVLGVSSPLIGGADDPTFGGRLQSSSLGTNSQVVPIEIIGLDPALTNSIIYGGGEGELQLLASGHNDANSATSGESSGQRGASSSLQPHRQQQTRGSRKTNSNYGPKINNNQPSILHIHHFHPPSSEPTRPPDGPSGEGGQELVGQQQQQLSDGHQQSGASAGQQQDETAPMEQTNEVVSAPVAPNPDVQWPSDLQQQQQQQLRIQNQQLFVNDRGELVYLAVQDKTPAGENLHEEVANEAQPSAPSGGEVQEIAQAQSESDNDDIKQKHQHMFINQQPSQRVPIPIRGGQNKRAEAGLANTLRRPADGSQVMSEADRMVMVSYRPSQFRQQIAHNDTLRGPHYDGQESAASQINREQANKPGPMMYENYERFLSPSSVLNSTEAQNLELIDRLIRQMNISSLDSFKATNHQLPLSTSLPAMQQQQQQQQQHEFSSAPGWPSFHLQTRPLLVEAGNPLHAGEDLPQTAPDWSPFEHTVGLRRPAPVASMNHDIPQGAVEFLVNSQASHPSNSSAPTANHNQLTKDELLSRLQELRRTPNNSSSSRAPDTKTKPGRFELAQASNQSPPSYMKQNLTNKTNTNRPHNEQPSIKSSPTSSDANGTANSFSSTGIDLSDSSGLSNLAMAFIVVISLVTLALITASLIYRYRRRSMGRCSNLAGRSRLNLTQRTKHFVRSNFVNPNDVSSIRSISLSADGSTLHTTSGAGVQTTVDSVKSGHRSNQSKPARPIDRYTTTKSYGGTDTRCLSTFVNANPSNEKYHSNHLHHHHHSGHGDGEGEGDVDVDADVDVDVDGDGEHEEPVTDIKTLNTRLQRPSYLRSLILAPAESRKKQRSGLDMGDNLHYLNTKHQRCAATTDAKKRCDAGPLSKGPNKRLAAGAGDPLAAEVGQPTRATKLHTCTASPSQHRELAKADSGKLTNLPLSRHVVAPNVGSCNLSSDMNHLGHRL